MGIFSAIVGGKNQVQSLPTSGFGTTAQPLQGFATSKVAPAIQSEFDRPYSRVNYRDYVAGNTPQMQEIIDRLSGGEPLGGGGMMDALSGLKGMGSSASRFSDGFLEQAGGALSKGVADITQGDIQGFANPFSEQYKQNVSDDVARLRSQTAARIAQRGSGAFGSTAAGRAIGDVENQGMKSRTEIDMNMFDKSLAALEAQRGRQLTGAATGGNLASQSQEVSSRQFNDQLAKFGAMSDVGTSMTDANLKRMGMGLDAAKMGQDYNQKIMQADLTDEMERRGYNSQQIDEFLARLPQFQSKLEHTTTKSEGLLGKVSRGLNAVTGVASAAAPLFGVPL
jgi:hypothetical protein